MSVPANTLQVYTQKNIREDLINAIYNVDPFKTPFLNMAKKDSAKQTNHEWDTDSLAAQNLNNAAVEGDDPTAQNLAVTARMGNYTQISTKTVQISGTTQAVVAAGGSNKMGYQLLKKSKELKRDMEGILTYNQAKNAGSSSTTRWTPKAVFRAFGRLAHLIRMANRPKRLRRIARLLMRRLLLMILAWVTIRLLLILSSRLHRKRNRLSTKAWTRFLRR